jgi:hypothetical protein
MQYSSTFRRKYSERSGQFLYLFHGKFHPWSQMTRKHKALTLMTKDLNQLNLHNIEGNAQYGEIWIFYGHKSPIYSGNKSSQVKQRLPKNLSPKYSKFKTENS